MQREDIEYFPEPDKRIEYFECTECAKMIYEGDHYYQLENGDVLCDDCIDEYIRDKYGKWAE